MKSFKLGLFIIINLALGCHLLLAVEFDVNSTILNDDPDNVVFLESIDMEDRVGAYFHWSKGDLPSAQGKNIGIIKTSIRGLCTPVFPFLSTYNDWYVIPVLSTQLGAREIATVPRSIIDPLGIDPKNIDLSVVIQCTPVLEKQYGFDHILLQPHPYLHDFSGPFTAYTNTNTKCHMFRLDDRGGVFREVALIGDQNCISHTDQLSGNSRWIEGIDPTNINYDEFYTFISVVQVGTTTRNDGKITVQTPGRVAITLHILVPGIFVQRPSIFLEMLPHENVTTAMFITAYEAYAKANGNREDIVASLEALKGLFTLSPSAPTLPPSSAKTTPVTTTSPYVDQTEVAATTCSSFVDFSQASPPLCPGPKEYSDETNLFMGKVAAYGAPAQYWGWHADIRSNPWIKFELKTPTMISSFGFKGQPLDCYGQQRAPKNFILEGSMDDRLWTPLLNISNHTVGNPTNWNDFTISNPGIYKFLKLTVTANGGDPTYLIISQVRISPFGSNLQDQDVIGIFEQRHVFANHRQQIVLASGDLFKDDAGFPSTMRLENRLRQHIEGASQLVAESRAELRRLATSTSGTSGDEIARANMTISTCTPLINQNQKLLGAITAKTVPYVVMVAIKPDNKWHGTQHYVAFGIRDNHGTIEVYYADSLTATSPEKTAHINRIGELLKQAFSR